MNYQYDGDSDGEYIYKKILRYQDAQERNEKTMQKMKETKTIETVYTLNDAASIIARRAGVEAKKQLRTTFKKVLHSPAFIQKIVGMFLIGMSIMFVWHYSKQDISEPMYGFYVIMLIGLYLMYDAGKCKRH